MSATFKDKNPFFSWSGWSCNAFAYSQALQLATEHTYEMWIEIGRACYKIRRVEPALQAVESALEIDRVNPIGRNLLRRWSDEWVEMLDAEERYIVMIQAKMRSIWGRRKGRAYMKVARQKKRERKRDMKRIKQDGISILELCLPPP